MDGFRVKQETVEPLGNNNGDYTKRRNISKVAVIDLDSSDDDSSTSGNGVSNGKRFRVSNDGVGAEGHGEKRKKSSEGVVLPAGFLDPLPPKNVASRGANGTGVLAQGCKQFWKAGDFNQGVGGNWETSSGGMDHVRVHPRFLHSNATSHKWVLGAFAELLDNSLDESHLMLHICHLKLLVCNGATYVNIDMLTNKKDGNRMLLIEDNGGGMDPDKMRQCMSLGYSLKSKVADTIGQYGNGFKTSTMRLGADVIVFSRCSAKDGKRSTQSIGLLSYTFLRCTGKEDIVVPMLDYERGVREWKKIIRSSASDWDKNAKAVVEWSPFSSETDLQKQFDHMKDQGTRIIIYNLWEDDQGQLELDFDTDKDSYSSILYLRIPPGFRMILRGKDVQHHNIVNDMMMTSEVTYRPQPGADGVSKDSNIVAIVTMGFVKDAKAHIDVQGYNVYHKNRLIKPFWRLWNASGSDGRGVIGVLEANFVEPAHDKQGFERTIVLSRLESRLIQMQKTYWRTYCHRIGYAPRINFSPDFSPETSSKRKKVSTNIPIPPSNKSSLNKNQKQGGSNSIRHPTATMNDIGEKGNNLHTKFGEGPNSPHLAENVRDDDLQTTMNMRHTNSSSDKGISAKKSTPKDGSRSAYEEDCSPNGTTMQIFPSVCENGNAPLNSNALTFDQLVEENRQLKEKLRRKEDEIMGDLLHDLESERNRCKELEAQLEEAKEKSEILNKEQESIIDIFAEERDRRDIEEEALRKKLKLELEKMKTHKRNAS
ncbi:Histidine kinase-like ATPase, ATP-binding domain-containing protein [Cynara cardunculus var. scolymus]|uniref:Histidine kinase-like ATPase, ATP-binding domain-containing protein n=1 Tax=Cynara cardunculus var. scolymus TaxID=59895 RepID=A0A118JYR6_CYNCS|nr:Histidine kinase-like ATPase, ATP-binding domain-containing protein [Cynara cardunculus var. scolymus]